jgi:ankyrin repeat protein
MDYNGGTPLHGAVWKNHGEMVKALLAMGADPNAVDATAGWKPLYWAAYWGSPDTLAVLLKATNDDLKDVRFFVQDGENMHKARNPAQNFPEDYPACEKLVDKAASTRPSVGNWLKSL